MRSLVSALREAASSPDAWPEVLGRVANAAGAAGSALIIVSKHTGAVDEAYFYGLSEPLRADYVEHYARLDPYSPLLDRSWKKLSETLPDSLLRRSEWYNDFVLNCGVRDIIGTRLLDTPSHFAFFGIHQQIGRHLATKTSSFTRVLSAPLARAVRHHVQRLHPRMEPQENTKAMAAGRRFYFHVENGVRYPDTIGFVFSTIDDAVVYANRVAREMATDRSWQGYVVRIVDSEGRDITRVPIGSPGKTT